MRAVLVLGVLVVVLAAACEVMWQTFHDPRRI